MSKKRFPSIPMPGSGGFGEAVKEVLEIMLGRRGNSLDRMVSWRDLKEKNLVQLRDPRKASPDEGDLQPSNPPAPAITPPPPTGFTVTGAFQNILLEWDNAFVQYANHAYTEIWRLDNDNLANAVKVGTTRASSFADNVGGNKDRYYWIRHVAIGGKEGPYNASSGTLGRTSRDPDDVRDVLTSKDWSADTFYYAFQVVAPRDSNGDPYKNADGIPLSYQATDAGTTGSSEPTWPTTLGSTVTDGGVTWKAIEAGKAPLIIGSINGTPVVFMAGAVIEDASIEDAKIKELAADKIIAAELSAITADLGSITAGDLNIAGKFIVNADGTVQIISSSSGARMEMENDVIKVFDSNGVKRVQLGDLTA